MLARLALPVTVILILGGMTSCRDVRKLTQDLDGSADATFWFWGRLQGVQYRGNAVIRDLNDANLATARNFDVDGVANGFSRLSTQHAQMVRELKNLNAANADAIAVDYRDRLVAAHENLRDRFRACADATKQRDESGILDCKQKQAVILTEYVALCNEKDAVMSDLKDKFDREFNVME